MAAHNSRRARQGDAGATEPQGHDAAVAGIAPGAPAQSGGCWTSWQQNRGQVPQQDAYCPSQLEVTCCYRAKKLAGQP